MSVCGLSARSSRRVPPLMAPSPSLPPPLSSHPSLFCLIPPPTSLAVLIFLHHPSPPLLPLLISSLLPLFPISPPPVSSSLPSINFFLLPHLLSFPIQFFPTLAAPKCTHACLHTCALFLSSLPSTLMSLSPVCLSVSLSGVGSALPSPPECVLSSLHVKLTSWGHVDLFCPFSGITSHLFTNVSDAKSVSCSSLQP